MVSLILQKSAYGDAGYDLRYDRVCFIIQKLRFGKRCKFFGFIEFIELVAQLNPLL